MATVMPPDVRGAQDVLPPTNLHLQSGAYLPQNICGEGFEADDASMRNYGSVDMGG